MKEYETQEKIIYNYAFCYVLLIIAEAGRLFFYSINNKKGEGRILFIMIFLCDFFLTIFPCHAFFSLRNWIYPFVIETLYRAFLLTCLTMTTVYSFKVKFSTWRSKLLQDRAVQKKRMWTSWVFNKQYVEQRGIKIFERKNWHYVVLRGYLKLTL